MSMRFPLLLGLTASFSPALCAQTTPAEPATQVVTPLPMPGKRPMIELFNYIDVAKLLDVIANQYDVQIVVSGDLDQEVRVPLDFKDKTAEQAIQFVVKECKLQYRKLEDGVYLIGKELSAETETAQIVATAQIKPPEAPVPPENMALIPAGEFWMGTDRDDGTNDNQRDNTPLTANDARPRHKVTLSAFYIDKTEVTCEQYKKFCEATGYPTPPDWTNGEIPAGKAKVPVTRVSWFEADAYAKWMGKRLPTEGEWEKAAGGTEGRRYAWGNDWDPGRVVYGTGGPENVGSRPYGATPEGVLDLSGNVFEWTASWFDAYPNAPTKQPDFGTKLRVVRGGAWMGSPELFINWYRSVNRPQSRTEWIGFRCVKDAA
ncbi:hypothetical protein EON80_00735 [bacterium]|nr:MAG: hypothetical protein EON80_00735 [bacterium]